MKISIIIVLVVQLMFACSPLASQAASPDRRGETVQLWDIGREISPDCPRHKDELPVKESQHLRLRGNGQTLARLQQGNLLQELLPSSDLQNVSIHSTAETNKSQKCVYGNKDQGSGLLQELLAEASDP